MITTSLGIILAITGVCLLISLIIGLILFGTLVLVFLGALSVLWLGTLVYYVFFHKDTKPPRDDYSISQGKEAN